MDIFICIMETNPLHDGHKYLLTKIKNLYPYSKILILLSGNYVQRGDFAVFNKYYRANLLTNKYADLVLEIPALYSLQSAGEFAHNSLSIIKNIDNIKAIFFGSETADKSFLLDAKNTLEYISKNNYSKNISLSESLRNEIYKKTGKKLGSNDGLGISYLKSLEKLNLNHIDFIPIKRIAANHGDKNNYKFSSTALRSFIKKSNNYFYTSIGDIYNYIRAKCIDNMNTGIDINNSDISRINKNLKDKCNYVDFIESTRHKLLSASKINRFLLKQILDINDQEKDLFYLDYVHPLSISKNGYEILKKIRSPILGSKKTVDKSSNNLKTLFYLNNRHSTIYYSFNNKRVINDFEKNIYKK